MKLQICLRFEQGFQALRTSCIEETDVPCLENLQVNQVTPLEMEMSCAFGNLWRQ